MEKREKTTSSAMRKTKFAAGLAFVAAMASVLTSCSETVKCDFQPGDGKTIPVTMRITGIEQIPFSQVTGMTKAGVSPAGICSKVNFAVYSSQGESLSKLQINQDAADEGFGTATFNLEEGTYKIVVLAHGGDGNPTMTVPTKITFNNKNTMKMTDTFLYSADVTVSADVHEFNLELKRAVAMFQLHLTDANLPDEVSQLRFEYSGGSSTIDAVSGLGCVASKQTETLDCKPGVMDYGVYTFIRSDSDKLKVKVSALNGSGEVLKEQEFQDVPIKKNYITRYSGEMFNKQILSTGFSVMLDNEWAGTTDCEF